MNKLILSIDQGTSSTKAVILTVDGNIICDGRAQVNTDFPSLGFVEQNPEEIFQSVITAFKNSLSQLKLTVYKAADIQCCGISNQRETFLLWDKDGKSLSNAVIWQCKRSISICQELQNNSYEQFIRKRTGLFIDPYFSGTKLIWLYRNIESIKAKIKKGEAFFGTIDTWLLYKLTGGKSYKTDYTNASRTLLFNLKDLQWDRDILNKFKLSRLNLPEVCPSAFNFGESSFNGLLKKKVPITAMIGDSHAASFGERCFKRGSAKATMGTGSSILLNTEDYIEPEKTSMVSTICWSTEKQIAYALEGVIVSCGSTINWLIEKLHLIKDGKEANEISESLVDNGNVYLIPAFSGLGAPWWKMKQKAFITGLTFGSDHRHIVRAGLESIVFQVTDVIKAMENDTGNPLTSLQIDGGVSSSSFVSTSIANLNNTKIIRCNVKEASAIGAALLAGLKYGIYSSIDELQRLDYNNEMILPDNNKAITYCYEKWLSIVKELK